LPAGSSTCSRPAAEPPVRAVAHTARTSTRPRPPMRPRTAVGTCRPAAHRGRDVHAPNDTAWTRCPDFGLRPAIEWEQGRELRRSRRHAHSPANTSSRLAASRTRSLQRSISVGVAAATRAAIGSGTAPRVTGGHHACIRSGRTRIATPASDRCPVALAPVRHLRDPRLPGHQRPFVRRWRRRDVPGPKAVLRSPVVSRPSHRVRSCANQPFPWPRRAIERRGVSGRRRPRRCSGRSRRPGCRPRPAPRWPRPRPRQQGFRPRAPRGRTRRRHRCWTP
jgi:hypothetical protein